MYEEAGDRDADEQRGTADTEHPVSEGERGGVIATGWADAIDQ